MKNKAIIAVIAILLCSCGGGGGGNGIERKVTVAYGTSFTASGGWVEQLSCRPINEGLPGENSSVGLSEIANVLKHEPDAVSVEFAINDAALRWGISPQESYSNMKEIISIMKAYRARVILIITGPVCDQYDWPGNRLESYYQLHKDLAHELGIEVIDLYDELSHGICETPDHIHPSQSMWNRALPKLEKICQ